MFEVNKNTPLAALTVGQLMQLFADNNKVESIQATTMPDKRLVYGLRGIRQLFDVSHATAQRYKDTFLQPAIMQNGRKIVVDVDKAMELFAEKMEG